MLEEDGTEVSFNILVCVLKRQSVAGKMIQTIHYVNDNLPPETVKHTYTDTVTVKIPKFKLNVSI